MRGRVISETPVPVKNVCTVEPHIMKRSMKTMLPETPDPVRTYLTLKRHIQLNSRPATLIHQFLASGSNESNLTANILIDNYDSIVLLCSPDGRKWLHTWLDDTLDYLKKIVEAQK